MGEANFAAHMLAQLDPYTGYIRSSHNSYMSMDDPLLDDIRSFVQSEVAEFLRTTSEDTYPEVLIERMRQLGLFGANISQNYGGLGLTHQTLD